MGRSNLRKRMFKAFGVDTLPCVWCHKKLHMDDKDCTVEHILCQCVKEHASDSYDNCKIACIGCNNLRGTLCIPELHTYRFWEILQGRKEEAVSDQPLMNAYFDACKCFNSSPSKKTLYEFMKVKCTKIKDREQIELFTKNNYHLFYMKSMSELLGVDVNYK